MKVFVPCFSKQKVSVPRVFVQAAVKAPGVEVFVGSTDELMEQHFPMDSVQKVTFVSQDDPGFLPAVKSFCMENEIKILVPIVMSDLFFFAPLIKEFKEIGVSIPIPSSEGITTAYDKYQVYQLAKEAGLPQPETVLLEKDEDIKKIKRLKYPLVFKPNCAEGASGVLIYSEAPSSWSEVKELIKSEGEVLAQEFIPVEEVSSYHCNFMFDENHTIKLVFQSRVTETAYDFGGPATAGEPVVEKKIEDLGLKMMSKMPAWVGPACLEFRKHRNSGEFYLIDINPRTWGYSSLAEHSGMSFPVAQILIAAGIDIRSHRNYPIGIEMKRDGAADVSLIKLHGGKSLEISESSKRNKILLCQYKDEKRAYEFFKSSSEFDAMLVLFSSTPTKTIEDGRVFYWNPPPSLFNTSIERWVAHILSSDEVYTYQNGLSIRHDRRTLESIWWGTHLTQKCS